MPHFVLTLHVVPTFGCLHLPHTTRTFAFRLHRLRCVCHAVTHGSRHIPHLPTRAGPRWLFCPTRVGWLGFPTLPCWLPHLTTLLVTLPPLPSTTVMPVVAVDDSRLLHTLPLDLDLFVDPFTLPTVIVCCGGYCNLHIPRPPFCVSCVTTPHGRFLTLPGAAVPVLPDL